MRRSSSDMKMDNLPYKIALSAMSATVGSVIMLMGNVIPILTYASPLFAGLMLIPPRDEFGSGYGWMTWTVTASLAILLCTDREAAFFYLLLGYYPLVKPVMDRIKSCSLRILTKLILFTAMISVLLLLLALVMGLEDLKNELILNVLVYGSMIVVMMVYDRLLTRMAIFYQVRLRKILLRRR